jgi:hypothetical protein
MKYYSTQIYMCIYIYIYIYIYKFSAPVQTGPGAHPPSYTMSTGSLSRE